MKAFIVSRTPSIRKAIGTPGKDGCPFAVIWTTRADAQKVCDTMNARYAVGFRVYEIEAKIVPNNRAKGRSVAPVRVRLADR